MVCETYFAVTVLKVLQRYISLATMNTQKHIKLSKDYENILKKQFNRFIMCIYTSR